MAVIILHGRITETGELEFKLPEGLPPGQVEIVITPAPAVSAPAEDEPPLTDAEIADLLRPAPLSGAEIVARGLTGGWVHKGITDSQAWVDAQRRQRRERRRW